MCGGGKRGGGDSNGRDMAEVVTAVDTAVDTAVVAREQVKTAEAETAEAVKE